MLPAKNYMVEIQYFKKAGNAVTRVTDGFQLY